MQKVKHDGRTCEVPTKTNLIVPSLRRDAKNAPIVKELLSCYDYVVLDRSAAACGFGDGGKDRTQCRPAVLISAIKRD